MKKLFGAVISALLTTFPGVAAEALAKHEAKEISQISLMPSFYDFEGIKKEEVSPLISRQYIYGAKSMLVKWTFKKA